MLTKRLTKFLLKRLFGKYIVCDLDLDQLDVELRSGLIHLKDIDLAIDAINDILGSLPLRIKSGFARSVTVQVPYAHIWASNFKCRLELNYLEIAFTPNDRSLSPDNPSSKLVSSLLSDLDKSKLECESESDSDDDGYTDGSDMAMEGVEELTKLFQKLFLKVSAAITSCVLLFDFYSQERGKDVRLVLTIQSLEYGNLEGNGGDTLEKTVKIRDYRVELLERDHKVSEESTEDTDEDEVFTEKSVIIKGGSGSGEEVDFVRLQLTAQHGVTAMTCDFHQLTGTLTSKQLTPLLEAAAVFSRTPPPPAPPPSASSVSGDSEQRLGSSLPDSFRASSFEKELKVGSFEKSLSPHDLRAIHEMLNHQKNSRSNSSLSKLEAQELEAGAPGTAGSDKAPSLLSEEDYSRDSGSEDSDDDMFFECNDDISGDVSSVKDKKTLPQVPEFQAVINIRSGYFSLTDNNSWCKITWSNMKISHSKGETSLTLASLEGEEGSSSSDINGGVTTPLFCVDKIDEEPPTDVAAFGFAVTRAKREVNVELSFQPLNINLDQQRISRISSLASSFLSSMKETSAVVTSWKPNISKPSTPVHPSSSPSPSPPQSSHQTRPVHVPSSFPHNIPGRNNVPHSTSPHSVSPRSFPQALVPVRNTPPQGSFSALRAPLSNSFPRNKVQTNPSSSHSLLSLTNSPLQSDYGNFVPSLDNQPSYFFRNNSVPHGITIPLSAPPQISGFLPSPQYYSGSPIGRNNTHHYDSNEDQAVKRQITFKCPTIFVNIKLTGVYEGSKVRLSVSNAKMYSCTFSNDEPSTPIKWFLDIHTLDAWLHSTDNSMHPLFEAQLHNTDSEGSLLPIEITLRPRPLEVNYAWPSSFDDDDTELHELFRHKAMESAQTVVQVVLPHTRMDLSKSNYEAALSILDVFSDPSGPNEVGDASKDNQERIDHGHVTRTTQLALVVFITHGIWTFRDAPTPSSTRAHELDFSGFKLVHVSQNVNYSVKRNIPLGGYDIVTRSAVFTSIVVDDITLSAMENAVESVAFSRTLGHKTRSIFRAGLSDDTNLKTINLAFRGITINYSIGSDWLFRLVDFFTPTPLPSSGESTSSNSPPQDKNKENTPSTQLHVDFDEVSVLYIPPHPLTSRLVLFVEDLRLHIMEFSPLSLDLRSNHCEVLLWDGFNAPKTKSAWHEGFVTIACHNGLELNISRVPSSVVDIVFTELFVDLCEDSLHVLLELVSNYLGLDIPLSGVADLIVSEDGQDLELSSMLADALTESGIYEVEQKLYPSMDEMKPNYANNSTNNNNNNNNTNTNNNNINNSNNNNNTYINNNTTQRFGFSTEKPGRNVIIEDDDEDEFDDVNMQTKTPIKPTSAPTVYNNYNDTESDEEGMFLEVKPMEEEREEASKSHIKREVNDALTTSMVGSLVIDDYDPDVAREPQEDNVIYVEVVPSTPSSSSSRRGSKEPESTLPVLRWLGEEERVTFIENYIDTLPPPSDTVYSLPRDYPPSVARTALRAISGTLRLHAGSHWPNMPSVDPFLEVKLMDLIIVQDVFAPVGPQASRLVVHLADIEITDHVPTSVWHLFLCYDVDVPRMRGAPIILLELDSVRPDPQSILEEYRARLSILPLRFNIDQDAVQFIIKFLLSKKPSEKESEHKNNNGSPKEFKTKRSGSMTTTPAKAQEMMFFQSFEIKSLRIKVDYKPKRVDYRSLQKGNVAELLNLFHLEGAVFHLTRIKANGLAGLAGVAKTIGDDWVQHIINTQVYNYVAGVRGIRSLVNVGEGVADLVLLPLEGYKKDGKIIQGLKKGSSSFLKVLALETLHLGSQVAAGTQNFLESAHSMMFTGTSAILPSAVTLSKLAAQPEDTREGLAHALKSVKRELHTAARTIIAVPIEEYSRAGPQGAMRSVIRAVPVAILRPVIGLTEGISKVALGVRNDIASDALKTDLKNKYKQ